MAASTIAPASAPIPRDRVARDRRFYVWMSGAIVVAAFGGFTPTFWRPMATGASVGAPILYIHGALFTAWVLFLFVQSALVASGRTLRHKDWGLAGVALAGMMAFSVPVAVLNSIHLAELNGFGESARRFSVVPLVGLLVWGSLLIVAFANVRRPETHKRLIIVASAAMLQAAIARVFILLAGAGQHLGPSPPVFFTIPAGIIADLFIVAGMIYDWRSRGRPHRAYVIGGAAVLAVQLLVVPLSMTPQWLGFVEQFERLRG
ncbi:hypothetical protein KX816_11610 [Sphingosinicellaceae bacterium]|nr:hypothetical protein KX816_11610 [Sphingosinicellaceae bacterium]